MELATPLRPSALLPITSTLPDRAESSYVDPPSIPLPLSPVLGSTPSSVPEILLQLPSSRPLSPAAHVERVENELAATRRQLQEGEDAVSQLRYVVENLR